jgi:hypothetical protein
MQSALSLKHTRQTSGAGVPLGRQTSIFHGSHPLYHGSPSTPTLPVAVSTGRVSHAAAPSTWMCALVCGMNGACPPNHRAPRSTVPTVTQSVYRSQSYRIISELPQRPQNNRCANADERNARSVLRVPRPLPPPLPSSLPLRLPFPWLCTFLSWSQVKCARGMAANATPCEAPIALRHIAQWQMSTSGAPSSPAANEYVYRARPQRHPPDTATFVATGSPSARRARETRRARATRNAAPSATGQRSIVDIEDYKDIR